MADPWTFGGESVSLGQATGAVTLVQGSAFSISGRSGDMVPGSPHGLFFRDTRFLSRFEVRLNGQRPEPLAAASPEPFSATFRQAEKVPEGHHSRHLSRNGGHLPMNALGAFGMILAGVGLVGIVATYLWGMAGAKK